MASFVAADRIVVKQRYDWNQGCVCAPLLSCALTSTSELGICGLPLQPYLSWAEASPCDQLQHEV